MTNEEKLREIFPKTIFIYRKEDDKTAAIQCSDEWLKAEYQESTTKNDLGVDCISRKQVLHWLENATDDSIENALNNNLDFISSITPQPRWIPVSEKRPVEFEKVLVTYRLHYDNSIHVGIGNITSNDINGRYHWNINEQDYIGWDMLAWMPLPQAYSEVEE